MQICLFPKNTSKQSEVCLLFYLITDNECKQTFFNLFTFFNFLWLKCVILEWKKSRKVRCVNGYDIWITKKVSFKKRTLSAKVIISDLDWAFILRHCSLILVMSLSVEKRPLNASWICLQAWLFMAEAAASIFLFSIAFICGFISDSRTFFSSSAQFCVLSRFFTITIDISWMVLLKEKSCNSQFLSYYLWYCQLRIRVKTNSN